MQSANAWHLRRRLRPHVCTRMSQRTPVYPVVHEYGLQTPDEPDSRLSHSPCRQLHAAAHTDHHHHHHQQQHLLIKTQVHKNS